MEVFDLERERGKRQVHYSCPDCMEKREECPAAIWPTIAQFEKWPLNKKRVWLRHTRHLI